VGWKVQGKHCTPTGFRELAVIFVSMELQPERKDMERVRRFSKFSEQRFLEQHTNLILFHKRKYLLSTVSNNSKKKIFLLAYADRLEAGNTLLC
jgi:hypothetical protein